MVNKTLNSNITYNGKVYHVQTEIVGEKVLTQVFYKGRVIFSYKGEYVDFQTTTKQHRTAEAAVLKGKVIIND
jgi:hypothetical protein